MVRKRYKTQVVIIGAGPAGLGCAALLKQMGINEDDLLVIDKGEIGQSFLLWPDSMRFITPSFPSNGYHQTDLNAITPDTSPAFSSGKEHLSGKEYAKYLAQVVKHYGISVKEHTMITTVSSLGPQDGFMLEGESVTIEAQFVIWAGGEFQTPNFNSFKGAQLCTHNSQVKSWSDLPDSDYIVIGGYESGVDAVHNLAQSGNKVTLLDASAQSKDTYDPSKVLSPYTSERLVQLASTPDIEYFDDFDVISVEQKSDGYHVKGSDGRCLKVNEPPINCTGFEINLGPVHDAFDYQDNGYPLVNQFDESTKVRNLFLAGPRLYHDPTLLCFIYKFRGRFASPCKVIAAELDLDLSILAHYQQAGMLLDDLGCCKSQECFC